MKLKSKSQKLIIGLYFCIHDKHLLKRTGKLIEKGGRYNAGVKIINAKIKDGSIDFIIALPHEPSDSGGHPLLIRRLKKAGEVTMSQ